MISRRITLLAKSSTQRTAAPLVSSSTARCSPFASQMFCLLQKRHIRQYFSKTTITTTNTNTLANSNSVANSKTSAHPNYNDLETTEVAADNNTHAPSNFHMFSYGWTLQLQWADDYAEFANESWRYVDLVEPQVAEFADLF